VLFHHSNISVRFTFHSASIVRLDRHHYGFLQVLGDDDMDGA
jgi:hypothetical protein